ncbi:hypothetical protein DICVIV_13927 [Dictyocaulus viviparus]|uniref:Uncharacterized protein n=1 Tax=Dictyocaulus viviparus TaxID=29172 RepID=A0A0D8X8P4_DICVI|nr:hypothetical protein DICVIV_13927 [Dictyocaulus viviparus]
MQPCCSALGRVCFNSLAKLGVCKTSVRHVDLNSLRSVEIGLRGLDTTTRDAERRRKRALRDLNERLNKTQHLKTIAWEEDIDDEDNATVEQETAQQNVIQVLRKHALRNIMIPALSVVAPILLYVTSGTVVIEGFFGVSGIATLLVKE